MKRIRNILVFITLMIGMSIFSYIPAELFKIDLAKLSTNMKMLYEFSCDLGFMLIIYSMYYKTINRSFKEYFKNFKTNFKLSISYYIAGFGIMVISNLIISYFFSSANANNEDAVRALIDAYPLYMLFSVGIYAPFIEEIIFRKSIKDIIVIDNNNNNKYPYIIISGLIFASLHVMGSVTSTLDYLYIIPYLGLGIAFAALFYKTDNIWNTIVIHSLHNIVAIILYWGLGL